MLFDWFRNSRYETIFTSKTVDNDTKTKWQMQEVCLNQLDWIMYQLMCKKCETQNLSASWKNNNNSNFIQINIVILI